MMIICEIIWQTLASISTHIHKFLHTAAAGILSMQLMKCAEQDKIYITR